MAFRTFTPSDEPIRPSEVLLSEANGYRSRDVAVAGGAFAAGQILGRLTSNGRLVAWAPTAETGAEDAVAVAEDASTGNGAEVVVYARDCEVKRSALVTPAGATAPQIAAALASLAAAGIVAR